MYEHFYGLNSQPFRVYPDPRPIFWSNDHAGAISMLRRSVATQAPVTLLTGPPGTGKTTLVNRLLEELPARVTAARVAPALACRGEPVDWLLAAFGQVPGDGTPAARHARFRETVLRLVAGGGHVLLVLDEAQALGADRLEELRLLAGFEEGSGMLLQMLLVGRPDLRRRLARPASAALAQRIAADFRLRPLGPAETAGYIAWRLCAAGAARTAFTPEAVQLVHEATSGVPRLINVLCDQALNTGFAERQRRIGASTLCRVLEAAGRRGGIGRFAPLMHAPRPSAPG